MLFFRRFLMILRISFEDWFGQFYDDIFNTNKYPVSYTTPMHVFSHPDIKKITSPFRQQNIKNYIRKNRFHVSTSQASRRKLNHYSFRKVMLLLAASPYLNDLYSSFEENTRLA